MTELASLLAFDDDPEPHLRNIGPSPIASVGSFAVWANDRAQPPVWPVTQDQFVGNHWGNRLKCSIIILATNPSGDDIGPLWGNFHVANGRSKDFRLASAFSPNGICSLLNGAYMTDLLKTVRGPKIRNSKIDRQTIQNNVDLFQTELETLNFLTANPRFIVLLGSGTEGWFCHFRTSFNLRIPENTFIMKIHHHSAAISDVKRDQEFTELRNRANNVLQQNNVTEFV